jgi:hypothetical protein
MWWIVDPQLVCFSNEAWFSLCGEVNSRNSQHWSAENPKFIHELPLHDKKIGVWCVIIVHSIIEPLFYDDAVYAARYVNNILSPFFAVLTEEERLCGVFLLASATGHLVNISLVALWDVFRDHIIWWGLWPPPPPPRSPDLTPCDIYLWGSLKDKVYKTYLILWRN